MLLNATYEVSGDPGQSQRLHNEALSIAREASDSPIKITNLNYLSRLEVYFKNYNEAIDYSQKT